MSTEWDLEVDVVVLGTGGAGLTAALTAAVGGASVAIYEKADTVGGTTAVSGGIVWIPAHHRSPDGELTVADAMRYLDAQSLGSMDTELVETFVRTGPEMLDFVEMHSELEFEIAQGFPDYKPELPGGRPSGGRSLNARPFDLARLGGWGDRITSFPADWSNVGIDAETRARIHASVDDADGDFCVAGTALIAGLLKGLLDLEGVNVAVEMPDLTQRDLIVPIVFDKLTCEQASRAYEKAGVVVHERTDASLYSARQVNSINQHGIVRISPLHCHTYEDIDEFLKITAEIAK